jgi:serine/threonine protein kinase
MTEGREQRIKSLFGQVADMPREDRLEYLKRACGDDEMIDEVLALCEGDEESNRQDFWEKGVWVIKSSANRRKIMIGENIRGYKIIKDLGGGGMGEVYLAERADGAFRRKAVIKFVASHLAREDKARFNGEMQALALLNHPNVAQIYDGGYLEGDGRPFMVMEYIEGKSLRELLLDPVAAERGDWKQVALSLDRALEIAAQACAGLAEAHRKKIVHRDIKPENIVISEEGRVKIIDFGLALPQESGMMPTRRPTAGIAGTLPYMSPEQLAPEKILGSSDQRPGPASDIYSLGVVIYEMLTGSWPFSGGDFEIARKHVEEPPPSLRGLKPAIPEAVDRVVLKALAKSPAERQKSMAQLAGELKAAIQPPPVVITQLETTESEAARKLSKFDRRKFLWAAPVVLAALLAPLAYFKPWERNSGGGGVVRPTPSVEVSASPSGSPTPEPSPPGPVLSMAVSVVRQDKSRTERAVPLDTTFHDGEGVRVSIRAAQKEYLYILQQGSSGRVSVLYPDPRISGGRNQIAAGQRITIPSSNGWFRFDKNPGTETVYFLYAENRTEGLMNGIEQAVASNGSALAAQLSTQAVDLSATGGSFSGQGVLVGVLKLNHQP